MNEANISKFFYTKTPSNETAWKIKDATSVLKNMCSKDLIVLGGDILDLELDYTYDNWFYNTDQSKDKKENSIRSIQKAVKYVDDYRTANGDDYYVVIVVK